MPSRRNNSVKQRWQVLSINCVFMNCSYNKDHRYNYLIFLTTTENMFNFNMKKINLIILCGILSCSFIIFGEADALPTNAIVEEIKALRQKNIEYKTRGTTLITDPEIRDMLDELETLKLIEAETTTLGKLKKKFFLTIFPGPFLRAAVGGFILLTEHNAPQTYAIIKDLSQKLEIPMPVVFLAGNKNMFNAFTSSLAHSMSMIFLGEDLLKALTLEQATTIIAHELCHVKKNHVPKKLLLNILSTIPVVAGATYVLSLYKKAYPLSDRLARFSIFYGTFIAEGIMLIPLFAAYSRKCEKEADVLAVEVTANPRALAHAIEVFRDKEVAYIKDYEYLMQQIDALELPTDVIIKTKANADAKYRARIISESQLRSWWFANHPSCDERIKYLNEAADKLEAVAVAA